MTSPREPLEHHLRENATRWFPDLADAGELRIEGSGGREGELSSIRRYRLCAGDVSHGVVAKLRPRVLDPHADSLRPRVSPPLDPETKLVHENAALRAIASQLADRGDDRCFAVRVLDLLESPSALLMEETPGRPLSRALARSSRLLPGFGAGSLTTPLANLGSWLRAYHDMSALPHTRPRSATRDEFVASVQRFARYLDDAHRPDPPLAAVAERAEALAATWLPDALPLAVGHGDLAPRNVLVDARGRVCVIDTRAAWRVPIYEDLAYFLASARTPRAQAASLGLAFGAGALRRLERAFLLGYFGGEPVPIGCIRLFELRALLDKWASRTEARERGDGPAMARAWHDWSADRLFQRSVASVLAQARGEVAA